MSAKTQFPRGGNLAARGGPGWGRLWLVGLAFAAPAVEFEVLRSAPPATTIVADCFQRGYQPPPCAADTSGGGGGSTSAPNPPPDSGVNACQNQAAMATALGLLPAVCPPHRPQLVSGPA